MEENELLKDDIVTDSYYLVNLFNSDSKIITQLQIQKLMYFFEAFYMCVSDTDSLYSCHFNAWALGPVAIPLYKEYKVFGNADIILSEEKIKLGNEINSFKKEIIKKIYDSFGRLSASQLVDLTHKKGSPWYNKWMENNQKVVYGDKSYIDKIETKTWFKDNFIADE